MGTISYPRRALFFTRKLKPGDIIFYQGSGNGRYKNIDHVALYYGANYEDGWLNSAGKKKGKKGSLFSSDKNGFHGFGLNRAEAILTEHGGWCKYNSEDGAAGGMEKKYITAV